VSGCEGGKRRTAPALAVVMLHEEQHYACSQGYDGHDQDWNGDHQGILRHGLAGCAVHRGKALGSNARVAIPNSRSCDL
jgi:hypothetical protein